MFVAITCHPDNNGMECVIILVDHVLVVDHGLQYVVELIITNVACRCGHCMNPQQAFWLCCAKMPAVSNRLHVFQAITNCALMPDLCKRS